MSALFGCTFRLALILGALLKVSVVLAGAVSLQLISTPDSSLAPSASAGGDSGASILSPDGRFVLFASTANNLVLSTNNTPMLESVPSFLNVYLRDRASNTTALVSRNLNGTAGKNGNSLPREISTNGQFALFESTDDNLVGGDTNAAGDVFVRDLAGETNLLVSTTPNGLSGNGAAYDAVMTPDGRYVAFVSDATNLVANDTNNIADVFVRDLQTSTTVLVSVGAVSNGSYTFPSLSAAPRITADGRFVAFYSSALQLVPGINTVGEVFVRDLIAGTTLLTSPRMASASCSSPMCRASPASTPPSTYGTR